MKGRLVGRRSPVEGGDLILVRGGVLKAQIGVTRHRQEGGDGLELSVNGNGKPSIDVVTAQIGLRVGLPGEQDGAVARGAG